MRSPMAWVGSLPTRTSSFSGRDATDNLVSRDGLLTCSETHQHSSRSSQSFGSLFLLRHFAKRTTWMHHHLFESNSISTPSSDENQPTGWSTLPPMLLNGISSEGSVGALTQQLSVHIFFFSWNLLHSGDQLSISTRRCLNIGAATPASSG